MTEWLIHEVRALQPGTGIVTDALLLRDGRVAAWGDEARVHADGAQEVDGNGSLLTPGLIDIHTHGLGMHMFEAGPEQLHRGASMVVQYGVTSLLPTLYNVMRRDSLDHLEALADTLDAVEDVNMPGFHMEGPFLALPGAGGAVQAGDTGLLEELLAASKGKLRAMSVSPDTPNILPVIEQLVQAGVVPFITHTQATAEETQTAIDAGVRHATHFYDVFPLPPAAEPGVRPAGAIEVMLTDPRTSVDFIVDGVHIHPAAIRCAVRAKGFERVILITDSNVGTGLEDGVYTTTWGFDVRVQEGDAARIEDPGGPKHRALAGSILTMNRGIRNLRQMLDLPDDQVWAMGSTNAATLMGLPQSEGLSLGAPADLVLWDESQNDLRPSRVWTGGRMVYQQ
jgi:N-acetylglucosamine-6-phosphate deacetylase